MEDAFLIKIVDNLRETENITICKNRKELIDLINNLDNKKYVIINIDNIGLVYDYKEFIITN